MSRSDDKHQRKSTRDNSRELQNDLSNFLPLHWLEPVLLPEGNKYSDCCLASFVDLQRKTLRTLYGDTAATATGPTPPDKSPKGSVDSHIQQLIELINQHSHYCTLSSCSGRMSLFNPNGSRKHSEEGISETAGYFSSSKPDSGKGRGGWVLVSHELLSPESLFDAMETDFTTSNCQQHNLKKQQPWIFKFEPMLLHVAAASLSYGQQLLRLALDLGFRESGLVVTESRVTVAIRSHSLALAVPLCRLSRYDQQATLDTKDGDYGHCSLQAPAHFLRALVREGNKRLIINWNQLDRLYQSIEKSLFRIQVIPSPICLRTPSIPSIPPINLWNATAIYSTNTDQDTQSIWVIGGYGCGPLTSFGGKDETNSNKAARRSSTIFKLERSVHTAAWDEQWKMIDKSSDTITSHCEELWSVPWSGRIKSQLKVAPLLQPEDLQGMASCRLEPSNCVVLWGGRKGPNKPSEGLFVFDAMSGRLARVCDVRGEIFPKARWGHAIVALVSGNRAILMGGCNQDDGAFDDVFALHLLLDEGSEECFFYWERLSLILPRPIFHFGASLLENNVVSLTGGLSSTPDLISTDMNSRFANSKGFFAFEIEELKRHQDTSRPQTNARVVKTIVITQSGEESNDDYIGSSFGMSFCILHSKHILLIIGGLSNLHDPCTQSDSKLSKPIRAFWVFRRLSGNDPLRLQELSLDFRTSEGKDARPFNFASLVHHNCIAVSNNSFVLAGGGIPSFSFGEEYAKSHYLEVCTDRRLELRDVMENAMSLASNPVVELFSKSIDFNVNVEEFDFDLTNVVFVRPRDAKQIKQTMRDRGWLDKSFRMIKTTVSAENTPCVAIPVTVPISKVLEEFSDWILDHGRQKVPFSTSQYASKSKR